MTRVLGPRHALRRTFRTGILLAVVLALAAGLVPSVASARENLPIATFCDDLDLEGCDGSVEIPTPTSSGYFEPAGLHLAPSGSGGLSGGLAFEGPRGGPAGAGLSWSGSGDGLVGVGFDLTGVPSFDRCALTPLLDGDTSGDLRLNTPAADASWCVNGERLEDVSGNGTEYRTKVESGQVITVGGGGWSSTTPEITITDSDGTSVVFAERVFANGQILSLLPSSATGINGATVAYDWNRQFTSPAEGLVQEHNLATISWGGNANTNRPNEYEATFSYEDRDHAMSTWVGGSAFQITERLSSVEIAYVNGNSRTPLRNYELTYVDASAYDSRTYLQEIRRCEQYSASFGWSVCTEPTVYEWDNIQTNNVAFDAQPGADKTKWASAINGGSLGSPYEVGQNAALRSFYRREDGTTGFRWRDAAPESTLPEIALAGPAVSSNLHWQIDSFNDSFDIAQLVSDRDYFYDSTVCFDRSISYPTQLAPTVCGVNIFPHSWCLFNTSSVPGNADQILANMTNDAVLDDCLGADPDYLAHQVYDNLHNAYAGQLASLVASVRINADLDCDGLDDDWIEPNFFGPSNIGIGDAGWTQVSATGPQLTPTNEIITAVSTVGVQNGHRKFARRFDRVVRSLADAYSGLVVADFNADCMGDLYQMYGNSFARDNIWLGDGTGQFTTMNGPVTWLQHLDAGWITTSKEARFKMQVRSSDKSRFRFGHFNHDRYLDVAYVNGYADNFSPSGSSSQRAEVSVWLNNGDGTWDKQEDGPNLVVREPLDWSPNDTPMALALTNRDIAAVQFGRFNNDDCDDMLYLNRPRNKDTRSSSYVEIFYSKCDGTFVSESAATPILMTYEGKNRENGRTLDSWHIEGTGDIPDEIAQLWAEDTAMTNSVKTADFNGDGLADLYKIDSDGRDTLWLNQGLSSNGDATFVSMAALDYGGHGKPTTQGGAQHPDVSWTDEAQYMFDIGRYGALAYDTALLPGMWIGGFLVESNETGDLIAGAERYYGSNFRNVQLGAYTDSFGNRVDFEWAFHRETLDPLAHQWILSAMDTTVQATAGGGSILSGTATGKRDVTHRTEFTYSGLAVDPVYGSLGFDRVTAEQVAPADAGRVRTVTYFWQDDHRLAGIPKYITTSVWTGSAWTPTSQTRNRARVDLLDGSEWGTRDALSYRVLPHPDCANDWGIEKTFNLDGTLATSVCTTTSDPDIWGNLDWTSSVHEDGSRVDVTHAFDGSSSGATETEMRRNGLVGATVTTTTSSDGDVHEATKWVAWDVSKRLPNAITEPLNDGSGDVRYEHLRYDAEHNPILRRTGGTGTAELEEVLTWDGSDPLTTTTVVDGVTHTTRMVHDNVEVDAPTRAFDVNGVSVTTQFESTGRIFNTYGDAVGGLRHVWGAAPSFAERASLGALWVDWIIPEDGLATFTAYDRHGRVVREGTQTPIGMSVVNTYYDEMGRASEISAPYVPETQLDLNARDHLNVIEQFDAIGRPLRGYNTEGIVTESTYDQVALPSGVTVGPYFSDYPAAYIRTTTSTVNGVQSHAVSDSTGQAIAVVNSFGDHQHFDYDAAGNVTALRDDDGNETIRIYDDWGRLRENQSPDLGTTVMSYDARDAVIETVDAKGNTTNFVYDALGRGTLRVTKTPGGALEDLTSFQYDSQPNGIGLLARFGSLHERVDFTYTNLGQVETETTTIRIDGSDEVREMRYFYDNFGRAYRTGYDGELFVDRIFDPNTGAVIEVQNADDGSLFWAAGGYDTSGRLALTRSGNGTSTRTDYEAVRPAVEGITLFDADGNMLSEQTYAWDGLGNLDRRTLHRDGQPDLGESFTYDDMNRLETSTVDGLSTVSRTYNNLGHLRTKSNYSNSQYNYGGVPGAGPSAASRVGPKRFDYDSNGNQILEKIVMKNGVINTVATFSWTAHNKLDSAERFAADGTLRAELGITYGAEGDKVYQSVVDHDDSETTATWYFNPQLRRVVVDGVGRTEIDVAGPAGAIATVTVSEASGLESTSYHHLDHLGSPIQYTDEDGVVIADRSFSVDGAARNADTWAALPFGDDGEALFEDGFTGHDSMAQFGLVNMGARIYDQHRGQFIQADTYDGELRYGYANNNPLSFSDPDGNSAVGLLHLAGNFALNSAANSLGVGYSFGSTYGSNGTVASYGMTGTDAVVSDLTGSMTSGGGGKSWTRLGAEIAVGVGFGILGGFVASPLGPGAVLVGALVGETASIALFALIDGVPILDRLEKDSTFSGAIKMFRGSSDLMETLSNPNDWFNLLTGLFGGAVTGAIGDALRKLPTPSSATLKQAADAIAGMFQSVSDAASRAGQALSSGWTQFKGLIDDMVHSVRSKIRPPKAIVHPDKFDYLFGKVASNQHNLSRSLQNGRQLSRVGVFDNPEGRKVLMDHFDTVVRGDANVVRTWTNEFGTFQARESLFKGPRGFLKFESSWQVTPDGLRMTTVIPMGGPKMFGKNAT